jgi:hypothetical protein
MYRSVTFISSLLIFFLTTVTLATEFKVLDFQEGQMDMRGTVRPYKDMNADLCAVLRVESDVPGDLNLTDVQVYHRDKESAGVYYFYVSFRERHVTLTSDGYLPLTYKIPEQMAKGKVYIVRIKSFGQIAEPQSELPVTIRVEPTGSDIRIDDKAVDVSSSIKLVIGEHSIEIIKSGYVTIREEFSVSDDNVFFEYTLEKPKLCIVEVSTDPSGAEVSIDGVKLNGTTPVSDFYNSGSYPIKITLDKYLTIEETINIDQSKDKSIFSYRFEANTGTIVISSEPEKNMAVTLNGKSVGQTPLTIREQDVGDYTVSGSHEYYTAESLEFTLHRGETHRAELKAEENFAILTVNTTPGATVFLNNQKLSSLKDLRLSPQTARLRAEKPKCETVETTRILRRSSRETVDLILDEQVGTIAISVDPLTALIDLKGDAGEHFTSTGTKIFEDIPVGSYELEVSLKGYKTDKRNLRLSPAETMRERIALKVGGGGDGPIPGMVFVEIPTGSFQMGSNDGDNDEKPIHTVHLSSFQMMTTEVTQAMWKEIMGSNPSNWKGDNLPVEKVSWYECQDFIKKLNHRDPDNTYRLPTEAEWEYTCHAGTTTRFYSGKNDSDLDRVGWSSSNSGSKTHPVGQKQPNAWGLYDMHGNVWEWCEDWYHSDYIGAPNNGTAWTSPPGSSRVFRGGSWFNNPGGCRGSNRSRSNPIDHGDNYGFRLVRVG